MVLDFFSVLAVPLSAALTVTFAAAQAPRPSEPTAERIYKNVQVLKGVPKSQFLNTMFFQRYALGVSCTYCHVDGQWDSDDKPAKVKARQMIRMVLDLNRNTFKDDKAVNCVTCHRGSTKPQTEIQTPRLSFDQMLMPPVRSPTSRRAVPAALPSPDSVIARYILALGGADKLARIAHTVITGTLFTAEGLAVPYEEYFATSPTRHAYIQHFGVGIGDFSHGFDGTVAWTKDNRGLSELTGQARGAEEIAGALQTGLHLEDLYDSLKVISADVLGSTPVIVLYGRARPTGQAERLYFDASSGLLLRRSTLTEGAYGNFTSDVYYENYRLVDGIMMPLMISQFSPDFGTVKRVRTVDHDTIVDPSVFMKPK